MKKKGVIMWDINPQGLMYINKSRKCRKRKLYCLAAVNHFTYHLHGRRGSSEDRLGHLGPILLDEILSFLTLL